MKITYLLPVASHVRYHKRVSALQALGCEAKILAFERDYYPGKPWPDGYLSLGKIQNENYCRRPAPFAKALPIVLKEAEESDVIYAFGLDTLFLAWLASRFSSKHQKIIYEVGDIRAVLLGKSLLARSLRRLERFLLRHVHILVVTSEAFISGYFHGIQGLMTLRYQVIENKLDESAFPTSPSPIDYNKEDGGLRIGYFGLIRCCRSWQILKRVVNAGSGQAQLYLRGISMGEQDLDEEARIDPQIDYGGPYVVPDDLPSMYGQVDMVWACYPYQGDGLGNWRWARTNRFYEACRFQRPMFAQKGTEDGRLAETLGLGVSLDLGDVEGTVDRILQIKHTDIDRWRQNMAALPKEVYTLSNEHKKLIRAIQ